MQPVIRHLLTVCAILALSAVLYSRVTTSYFCGFDDFIELHRSAFEDKADPIKIITTTHYGSFKYRPLNRALSLYTYLLNPHGALPFRLRNLFFHGIAVVSVYWLGWLLFGSFWGAGAAALLFAIHPLANQSVIGAVWTNTVANSLCLLSLALFIWSYRCGRLTCLALALFCGAVAVYAYEAEIVGAGLMASWMALDYFFHRRLPSKKFLLMFVLLGGLLYGSYLGVRHFVVTQNVPSPPLSSVGAIARNVTLYAAGILLPFDPVVASDWFGTPFPNQIVFTDLSQGLPFESQIGAIGLFLIAGVGIMGVVVLLLFVGRSRIVNLLHSLDWQPILFLLLCMPIIILPLLLFTEHPSETYVYLPVAFYCIILGYLLSRIQSRSWFSTALGIFALLLGAATWVRNQDVVRCAVTARTILSNLPSAKWKQGTWHIILAKAPDEPGVLPYGFYNYYGLDTIGIAGYGDKAIEDALQVVYGNVELRVDESTSAQLPSLCASPGPREVCYWIHGNGSVTEFGNQSPKPPG